MVPKERLVRNDEVGTELLSLADDVCRCPNAGNDTRAFLVNVAVEHLVACGGLVDGAIAHHIVAAAIVLYVLDNFADEHRGPF